MKTRIGNRLLAIRETRRLSQQEMADVLELPSSTYARIERNETSVELEKLTLFATKLNVPIQELLPESLSITNNNHNSGNGGGIIFGNQYFFGVNTSSDPNSILSIKQKYEQLKAELEIIEELLKKDGRV